MYKMKSIPQTQQFVFHPSFPSWLELIWKIDQKRKKRTRIHRGQKWLRTKTNRQSMCGILPPWNPVFQPQIISSPQNKPGNDGIIKETLRTYQRKPRKIKNMNCLRKKIIAIFASRSDFPYFSPGFPHAAFSYDEDLEGGKDIHISHP